MEEHDFKAYPELTNSQMTEYYFVSPHKQIFNNFIAEVIKCHDGDTVTLRTNFRDFDFPLRIKGINAAEIGEAEADKATEWLKQRVLGRKVEIVVDFSNRVGKYGRLIGDILIDGMLISEESTMLDLNKVFGKNSYGEIPALPILEEFLE